MVLEGGGEGDSLRKAKQWGADLWCWVICPTGGSCVEATVTPYACGTLERGKPYTPGVLWIVLSGSLRCVYIVELTKYF